MEKEDLNVIRDALIICTLLYGMKVLSNIEDNSYQLRYIYGKLYEINSNLVSIRINQK